MHVVCFFWKNLDQWYTYTYAGCHDGKWKMKKYNVLLICSSVVYYRLDCLEESKTFEDWLKELKSETHSMRHKDKEMGWVFHWPNLSVLGAPDRRRKTWKKVGGSTHCLPLGAWIGLLQTLLSSLSIGSLPPMHCLWFFVFVLFYILPLASLPAVLSSC